MMTAMPRRASDDLGGKLLVETYRKMLGSAPREALHYMAERALRECEWFPSIAECTKLLSSWQRSDAPSKQKALASAIAEREVAARQSDAQDAMENVMARLQNGEMSQAQVDELPRQFRSIAEARGLLMIVDGQYRLRPSLNRKASDPA